MTRNQTTHTYEFDVAMLGSEWEETDSMEQFAECLRDAFAARSIDCAVSVCKGSSNGGRGLICSDGEECDHISEYAIDCAWSDALEQYCMQRADTIWCESCMVADLHTPATTHSTHPDWSSLDLCAECAREYDQRQ